ncbi:hypothetical protein [Oscillatoria sp. FACHB-1406]|uniref:hypothetical protein n=1 Tax=Oscillatoria sp. FACHB-1406 TaxID=2692846 RepID=UPI0016859118|nr:hypothetical protein [Oscillatoria sp. FACHB-1406]MBD2577729.1 hypothetical protein [Oscillatoria sp. FACHB-1406]
MLVLVAIANLILALFNFYIAWKLQKWRRAIACLADILTCAENNARPFLVRAPEFILQYQHKSRQLKERSQQLQRQWQQLAQLLNLLNLLAPFLPKRWQLQNLLRTPFSPTRTKPTLLPSGLAMFFGSASEKSSLK